MSDTDRIRAAVDVPNLYASLYPSLMVGQKRTLARCFRSQAHSHGDKTPSVQLHRDGFCCHACGTKGDAIALVQLSQQCSFRQALVWLQEHYNVAVDPVALAAPAPWTWPDYTDEVLGFLQEIWFTVQPVAYTPATIAWLRSRRVDPALAWALGCRDWSPVLPEILSLIRANRDLATAAHLIADGQLWFPLRDPTPRMAGLCIPAFVPDWHFPITYRWRFAHPLTWGNKTLKTAAQPGAPALPLGLHVTSRALDVMPVLGARILIIAEGEPDWLSIHDALSGCCGVLGLCSVSGGWRSAWSELLRDVSHVIVATHAKKGDPIGKAVLAAMLGLDPAGARQRYLRIELREDCDANDLHKRDKLLPLLVHALKDRLHV